MPTSSKTGRLLELIQTEANGVSGITWETAPQVIWFPDFERQQLKDDGLTALVIAPDAIQQAVRRNRTSGVNFEPMVHVAVTAPMIAPTFALGDVVVEAAELLLEHFVLAAFTSGEIQAACTEGQLEPVISAEYAKQYGLWVSYLKLQFKLAEVAV